MKDIYSPLEIDEEWDNYSPMADGGSTALMERPPETAPSLESASTNIPVTSPDVQTPVTEKPDLEALDLPASHVMPGSESNNTGNKESTEPDAAYKAAEALIDESAPNAAPDTADTGGDTFDISDTSSSPIPDNSGLVKITPGEPTPETPTDDTPRTIAPIKINVMGDETPDSNDTLSDPIDESNGESAEITDATKSSDIETTPFITPVNPEAESKEEDSDDVVGIGTATPDAIKASDDDGESSDDNVENSESHTADDTDDTESDTSGSSSDEAESLANPAKADKPEVASPDDDDELSDILDRWDRSNKEIADNLEQLRKDIEENISRMRVEKSNHQSELSQQIAELDEGIGNEQAKLAKLQTNLSKLTNDKEN